MQSAFSTPERSSRLPVLRPHRSLISPDFLTTQIALNTPLAGTMMLCHMQDVTCSMKHDVHPPRMCRGRNHILYIVDTASAT